MNRFEEWQSPVIEHGKLTKWNWMIYHPENLILGKEVDIGAFTFINAKYGVTLEDNVQIGSHCSIYSISTIDSRQAPVILKKNVRIGSHSVILPGVTIGENTIIGANSFVNHDIPANCTAYGSPVRVMKKHQNGFVRNNEPETNKIAELEIENKNNDDKTLPNIPITKPTLPKFEQFEERLKDFFASGMITNHKYVKEFEDTLKNYLGVKNVIAVSSCTSGLMLSMKALKLTGEVILPSFTFSATGHAAVWAGLTPIFVDINPETFQIDPQRVREAITPETSAILAVHMFGGPAPIEELQQIAKDNNIKLIFDAAHAMGSKMNETRIANFGDVEVFSCSPTKLMVTGEGGIVTTNDDELARKIRIGRNYGDPGNYDCEFPGLNARMTEFNALIGIESQKMLDENVFKRNNLARLYQEKLSSLPGLRFQLIPTSYLTTFKDFSILIDPDIFGLDREKLLIELQKKGISTRRYFYPPLHEQKAYAEFKHLYFESKLPVTEYISRNILSLPLYSHMTEEEVIRVCDEIKIVRATVNQ